MARYWCRSSEWPKELPQPQLPQYMKDQTLHELAVTRLEEVKDLFHPYMDGIDPPLLDDQQRQLLLEKLENVSNEYAKTEGEFRIRATKDLDIFLKYANGVHDPDFRCEAICKWDPGMRYSLKNCFIEIEDLAWGQFD
ncbi:hypothetical protein L228DRAFT_249811 [Xylona heveae TC161]|uniref:Uncharacterized protein n=1 Tax=Xylona heveae (strain CBS 132557 / TC161) TaxID=1328760 RepID=A0A165A9P7_XYLHT|nr:hypothetical protein L228DRAFT_249811 [Xylona heveae TC161]KZF20138.1 hypothetical protein L228DRAFT_249811 [Xylona heveae TC161]